MTEEQENPWLPAARRAIESWQIDVAALDLVSVSENIVFKVVSDGGENYVMRLHRPDYHTLDELQAEHTWLEELRKAGLHVPVPVRTRGGEGYGSAQYRDEIRNVGLYKWVDGDLLGSYLTEHAEPSVVEDWFRKLGALAAEMHVVAERFKPPAGFHRHALDAEGTMGEEPFWPRYWDHPKMPIEDGLSLNALRQRIHHQLLALPKDPQIYGMIHADLHSQNVVASGDNLHVIDFDDAGFGWYQFDLAVALPAYGSADYDMRSNALRAGYLEARPVAEDFFDLVPLFGLVRSMTIIGWALSRHPNLTIDHLRPELDRIKELGAVLLD